MSTSFSDSALTLLDGKHFAVFASINADGSPQTSVVWYEWDGEALLFSAMAHRRKVRNIERDPRVSLTIFDTANPYHSLEIRGTASVSPDPERAMSYQLTHRYLGQDPPADPEGSQRVVIRVTPSKVVEFAAGA